MNEIGRKFQQQTKYTLESLSKEPKRSGVRLSPYKSYGDSETVELPDWRPGPGMALGRMLVERRSVRRYSQAPLGLAELSYLLWAANGITRRQGPLEFRTAPSAGAMYPIETYVVANRVEGLDAGLYHYRVKGHMLERLVAGDRSEQLVEATLGQKMCREAPVVAAWTAIFKRTSGRYGQRAYRYVYLDAAHVAANFMLAATSLGLGTCQIGAFLDEEVNALLGVDGDEESALYLSTAGQPGAE